MIKRLLPLILAIVLAPSMLAFGRTSKAQTDTKTTKTRTHKTRRHRRHKSHKRTTGSEYKQGGKDVGQGGKKLGSNVAHGRVVEGGKEFGKGVGHGAKHIAKGTKHAVDPNASKKEKKP